MTQTATRAAVLRAFGEPQSIEDVELRPPGPGEARVRILAAGVCHSDVGQAAGEWSVRSPVVLGHEGAGVVEEVGPDVEHARRDARRPEPRAWLWCVRALPRRLADPLPGRARRHE